MGAIVFPRIELISALSEHAGYKAGVALDSRQIARRLSDHGDYLRGHGSQVIRVRAEELDIMAAKLLYSLGNTQQPDPILLPGQEYLRRYRHDPKKLALFGRVADLLNEMVAEQTGHGPIDLTPLLERSRALGTEGQLLAIQFVDDIQLKLHQSPFSAFRRLEWQDTVALKSLFESEDLTTQYGEFLDQRFIDYLAQNIEDLDKMNWRKFEGLTAEFFKRHGFEVRLSRGRNDGNIDIRVWRRKPSRSTPPAMLVQCKRQKSKVGKVVVKALYADILDEQATSGLIVTTSALAPGAERICVARGYPIGQANRTTLRHWLNLLRTPGSGVFLGT